MPAAARGRAAGKSDKPWRDAIRRAVLRSQEGEKDKNLEKLADKLVLEGLAGDVTALREIGDRLDGKAAQPVIGGSDDDPPVVHRIERVIVRPKT